jgi:hypothetical protein
MQPLRNLHSDGILGSKAKWCFSWDDLAPSPAFTDYSDYSDYNESNKPAGNSYYSHYNDSDEPAG